MIIYNIRKRNQKSTLSGFPSGFFPVLNESNSSWFSVKNKNKNSKVSFYVIGFKNDFIYFVLPKQ